MWLFSDGRYHEKQEREGEKERETMKLAKSDQVSDILLNSINIYIQNII